ncbi:dipeptidase [Bifidobacterium scaligerum]|uniref:Peptidase M19 n=1 Tax=Bifidobacterium scaligerum TaxID=2052656 RepID=A0A2M9HPM4_9BIFI|nr:membrane dipeptidase [Bifidobacterium scaligerum]PJM78765.1 peptidase M19 [Bifidobacterium scaligerum]
MTQLERIVIDGHTDLAQRDGNITFDLSKAAEGGLNAAVVPAHAGLIANTAAAGTGSDELEATYQAIIRTVADSNGKAALARSADEVRSNAANGVFSFILGFQNARPLTTLEDVRRWIDRGVSVFDFGFIGSNQWAQSARPYPYASVPGAEQGLSELALEAIALLNEHGVIVDTAQLSPAARKLALEHSQAPIIASHNGLKSIVGPVDRALSDDEIRQIADQDGLVQVVAFDGYLTFRGSDPDIAKAIGDLRERFGLPRYAGPADYYETLDKETADWDAQKFGDYLKEYHTAVRHGWPHSTVSTLADAIDHVIDVAGADHVGFASDFNHGGGIAGWLNHADTANVVDEIARRHDEQTTAKIVGGNLLAVWQHVQELATAR